MSTLEIYRMKMMSGIVQLGISFQSFYCLLEHLRVLKLRKFHFIWKILENFPLFFLFFSVLSCKSLVRLSSIHFIMLLKRPTLDWQKRKERDEEDEDEEGKILQIKFLQVIWNQSCSR